MPSLGKLRASEQMRPERFTTKKKISGTCTCRPVQRGPHRASATAKEGGAGRLKMPSMRPRNQPAVEGRSSRYEAAKTVLPDCAVCGEHISFVGS